VDKRNKTFWSRLWSLLTAQPSSAMRSWWPRSGASWNRFSRENETFRSAINNLSQGVVLFDAQRRVIFCNARYAEIYALSEEKIRPGTPISQLIQHRIRLGLKVASAPFRLRRERLTGPVTASTVIQEFRTAAWSSTRRIRCQTMAAWRRIRILPGANGSAPNSKRQHSIVAGAGAAAPLADIRFDLAINNMTQGLCFF